ncbi:MAG: aldo/keto reductase [Gaiellales bacterium]
MPAQPQHADVVELGTSGVLVSRLGLGTAGLGGLFTPVTDDEAATVVRTALELGVRCLDTAPLYGRGLAESRVGRVLTRAPRASFTLSTKVGRLVRPAGTTGAEPDVPPIWPEAGARVTVLDFSADGVRRSLEESLERLGLDAVDVALVHDPDDHLDQAIGEALPALAALRDEGLVRAIGLGMNSAGPLVRVISEWSPDCVLVAGRLTLLDASAAEELLPLCRERGIGVLVGGVLNSGILARPQPDARYDYVPPPPPVVARAQALAAVCARHGVELEAAAIQFPLRYPEVDCVLVGVRSRVELEEAVRAFDRALPAELWRELADAGLLP